MSWSVRNNIILALFFIIFIPSNLFAKVYIYEVVTEETRFQTASLLLPDAFMYYNGGPDIIHSLVVIKVYPGNDFKKAVEEHSLGERNVKYLPHNGSRIYYKRIPYYWWR